MKPIYTTSGEWVAMLEGNYLYDTYGEWVGWLDGKDVYRQIKAIRPGIRVALSSGYDEQIALSGLDLHKEDTFLPKPYDLKVLLELAARSVTEKA